MDPIQVMLETLTRIRDSYGEEKFRFAAGHSVRMILAQYPERKEELRAALADMADLDELLDGPAPKYPDLPTSDMMFQAIKQTMPGIQTQAQFDITMVAFEALRSVLNATFLLDSPGMETGMQSLTKALLGAQEVTALSVKLSQVPEAATSPEAERFKTSPAQYAEEDLMVKLCLEVVSRANLSELNQWYKDNRSDIDRVVSQKHRNILLDKIRAKKAEFLS